MQTFQFVFHLVLSSFLGIVTVLMTVFSIAIQIEGLRFMLESEDKRDRREALFIIAVLTTIIVGLIGSMFIRFSIIGPNSIYGLLVFVLSCILTILWLIWYAKKG